jgi:hypothetical protein
MPDPACEDCRFYQPHPEPKLGLDGTCHRRAMTTAHEWPLVSLRDWCGEFERSPRLPPLPGMN